MNLYKKLIKNMDQRFNNLAIRALEITNSSNTTYIKLFSAPNGKRILQDKGVLFCTFSTQQMLDSINVKRIKRIKKNSLPCCHGNKLK